MPLYKCWVCGREFLKLQALRAHMRVHSREERSAFRPVTVDVRADLWERFKEVCRKHGTTTCQLINSLIQAVVRADELGYPIVDITANPLIICVQNVYTGRPRGRKEVLPDLPALPARLPSCSYAHRLWASKGQVYCRRLGDWVGLQVCLKCSYADGALEVHP